MQVEAQQDKRINKYKRERKKKDIEEMLHTFVIGFQDGEGRENGEGATFEEYLPRFFH